MRIPRKQSSVLAADINDIDSIHLHFNFITSHGILHNVYVLPIPFKTPKRNIKKHQETTFLLPKKISPSNKHRVTRVDEAMSK